MADFREVRQNRRTFIRMIGRGISFGILVGVTGLLAIGKKIGGRICETCAGKGQCGDGCKAVGNLSDPETVWQLDPEKCIQCGQCSTHCVLAESAVKCVHAFSMCGYCKLCFGYFQPGADALTEGAENQLCPTGAITRKLIEPPYHEYTIDEKLCIGCGKCVKGCTAFGNGSLHLQVKHDRCLNCNECAIARNCPAGAFKRVPADQPYMMKG